MSEVFWAIVAGLAIGIALGGLRPKTPRELVDGTGNWKRVRRAGSR
jgi:hypothetical protein